MTTSPARASRPEPQLREVYLHPGQEFVATSSTLLKMILGSCVGVYLFDPVLSIGGATHFMLPRCSGRTPSPRYGDVAISNLLHRFHALGSKPGVMQAKVFGGASMLHALRDVSVAGIGQIGLRNVETALEFLDEAAVRVVEKDVFGKRGRKVTMFSSTGETRLELVSGADGD